MRYLLKILVIVILTSCKTYNLRTISGHYRTKGGFGWGSNICMKVDSTFIYNWHSGPFFGETIGKWKIKGQKLVLNSYIQPKAESTPDYYPLEIKNTNSKNIAFDLLLPDSTNVLPAATGIMYKNGKQIASKMSELNGQMVFVKQNFDSIKISYIGLKNILITDTNNDYFKIASVENFKNIYEFFTNQTWVVRHRCLINRSFNKQHYEQRFYKTD